MSFKLRHVEMTEQGPSHQTNDDYLLVVPEVRLFIVCDGVSGHSGGSIASKMAAEGVATELRQSVGALGGKLPNVQNAALMLREAILEAGAQIYRRSSSDPALHNMATTLEVVWQLGEHVLCAHTGDSRVYLSRRGKLVRLTKDHSFVQEMMDSGSMTEEQAKKSPYAHALVHAIGIQATAKVDLLAPEVQEGDIFLMCTDGICGSLTDGQIATVMNRATGNLSASLQELLRGARVGGSRDDATMILLEIPMVAQPQPAVAAPSEPPPLAPAAKAPAVPPPLGAVPPPLVGSQPPPLGAPVPPPLDAPAPPPLEAPAARTNPQVIVARTHQPLPQDKLNALDLSPCFGELSFADKTRLLEISKQRQVPSGEVLAREGEVGDHLWVLITGKIRITERGVVVVDRVGPLTLGESSLMEQEPRAATLTVIEDAHVLEFDRAKLLSFFAPFMTNPAAQVYRAIATLEHKRMRELTHQLSEVGGGGTVPPPPTSGGGGAGGSKPLRAPKRL